MKRITIKDLAKHLGVNPSTISRALHDHPDVGEDLKRKITDLALQLGYRPNRMAISLRNRRSRLIGLIVPEVNMFFFPSVIRGVEDMAQQKGYGLIMFHSSNSLEREMENVQLCFENNVEGLLIALTKETFCLDHLEPLQEAGVPVVLFDKVIDHPAYPSVVLNDYEAASKMAGLLREANCSRVLGVFGDPHLNITQKRIKGFRDALQGTAAELQFIFADSAEKSLQLSSELLGQGFLPDGLFAMSDEVLIGAVAALKALDHRFSESCRVVCISDGIIPGFLNIRSSYLLHSGYEAGQIAMERLCSLIGNASAPADLDSRINLPFKVIHTGAF
jgi:LacI family transcriptional regulator